MDIIDTHCHIDLPVFDHDRDQILKTCQLAGIKQIIVPAIESASWDTLLTISNAHECLFPTLGLHPVFIEQHNESDLEKLDKLTAQKLPLAIGEIGLDFYITDTDKNKQKHIFEQQLLIAKKYQLPVVLHVRKAHDDVLSHLKNKTLTGGTCHAFNGSYEQAKRYIDLGFKLGFGGTLTFPNARKIHQLAKQIPLEHIVLETDAPDMSGYAHQGQRNQPDFIGDALIALSEIKQMPPEQVAEQTSLNARQIFNLQPVQ